MFDSETATPSSNPTQPSNQSLAGGAEPGSFGVPLIVEAVVYRRETVASRLGIAYGEPSPPCRSQKTPAEHAVRKILCQPENMSEARFVRDFRLSGL